jgi:hypothetical protein
MILKRRWLWFFAGRDLYRDLPASFAFVLFPRPILGRRHEVVRGLLSMSVSWAWLPTFHRVYVEGARPDGRHSSAAWTGRYSAVVGWSWPASFECRIGK